MSMEVVMDSHQGKYCCGDVITRMETRKEANYDIDNVVGMGMMPDLALVQ